MSVPFPAVTAAAAVVLALLQMVLMFYAASGRGQYRTGLGEGDNPLLLRRLRMHGNLAENAPLFLILLGLTEFSGQWPAFVPWFALAFVVARLLHVVGLAMSAGASVPRFLGVVTTLLCDLGLAVLLAITLGRDTGWLAAFHL